MVWMEGRKIMSEDKTLVEFMGQVKEFMRQQITDREEARETRKLIFDSIEAQKTMLAKLDEHSVHLEKRMKHVEASSSDFNVWKQRFIGMAMIVTLFSSAVAASVTFFLKRWFFS